VLFFFVFAGNVYLKTASHLMTGISGFKARETHWKRKRLRWDDSNFRHKTNAPVGLPPCAFCKSTPRAIRPGEFFIGKVVYRNLFM